MMLHAKPETKEYFLLEIDPWGDSYTKDATTHSLGATFERIKPEELDFMPEIEMFENKYYPKPRWGFFRGKCRKETGESTHTHLYIHTNT